MFGSRVQIIRFVVITSAFLLMSSGLPKGIQKKIDKEINAVFSLAEFSLIPKEFSNETLSNLSSKFDAEQFFEIYSDEILKGYAYLGQAPSKTDIFDYLVLFDRNLIVKKTKILVYREDYGGEIGSKRWLKQFTGKSSGDKLEIGNDIVAISGATISVRSMTIAMNNLLNCLNTLTLKGQF